LSNHHRRRPDLTLNCRVSDLDAAQGARRVARSSSTDNPIH